jgi:hypothetical protein
VEEYRRLRGREKSCQKRQRQGYLRISPFPPSRRILKKFRLLTRPTPARQDAPFRGQGRRRVETGGVPWGYVEDFDEPRTKLADFFSILL